MGREWKPGDVAVIRVPKRSTPDGDATDKGDADVPAVRIREGWVALEQADHYWMDEYAFFAAEARPLVVIDPEDETQVQAIVEAFLGQTGLIGGWKRMQAALREFANPKPPKPEEPTGLGAVVEDADGHTWVRTHATGYPWHANLHPDDRNATAVRKYADIDVARVLSHGYTEEPA